MQSKEPLRWKTIFKRRFGFVGVLIGMYCGFRIRDDYIYSSSFGKIEELTQQHRFGQ